LIDKVKQGRASASGCAHYPPPHRSPACLGADAQDIPSNWTAAEGGGPEGAERQPYPRAQPHAPIGGRSKVKRIPTPFNDLSHLLSTSRMLAEGEPAWKIHRFLEARQSA